MAALIACGVVWRALRPFGLEADTTRRALTGVVFGLFLPELVLQVLLIQLLLMPLYALGLASALGLQGSLLAAGVLEAATPSMVGGHGAVRALRAEYQPLCHGGDPVDPAAMESLAPGYAGGRFRLIRQCGVPRLGKVQRELAAGAQTTADLDPSAVNLGDVLDDGQPTSGAALLLTVLGIDPIEALEQPPQMLLRDARPLVAHADADVPVGLVCADARLPAVLRIGNS